MSKLPPHRSLTTFLSKQPAVEAPVREKSRFAPIRSLSKLVSAPLQARPFHEATDNHLPRRDSGAVSSGGAAVNESDKLPGNVQVIAVTGPTPAQTLFEPTEPHFSHLDDTLDHLETHDHQTFTSSPRGMNESLHNLTPQVSRNNVEFAVGNDQGPVLRRGRNSYGQFSNVEVSYQHY